MPRQLPWPGHPQDRIAHVSRKAETIGAFLVKIGTIEQLQIHEVLWVQKVEVKRLFGEITINMFHTSGPIVNQNYFCFEYGNSLY